jgi:leader peptidase (prepilin peptidase)/N-methyltransferase
VPNVDTIAFIALAVIGPFIGSFFNVLIHRLPRGEEVVVRPSHCPKCSRAIRWRDNIPVISWILLGGRCRDCRQSISIRYPLVELGAALLFIVTFKLVLSGGIDIGHALGIVACAGLLFLIFIIDIETYLIPDQLVWWGYALSILLLITGGSPAGGWSNAIIGFFSLSLFLIIAGVIGNAVVFPETFKRDKGFLVVFPWLFYLATFIVAYPVEHFRGRNRASADEVLDSKSATAEQSAMGGGDIKLAAFMGLLLGWKLLIAAFAFAIMSGGLLAAGMLLVKRATGNYERGLKLQFGPFLALGTYVAIFFGNALIEWYLRLAGLAAR